jgi:hypothetical protein
MIQVDKTNFSMRRGGPMVLKIRFAADTEDEALTGIPYTQRGGALVLQSAESAQWYAGSEKFIVDATYEGLIDDPPPDMDEYSIDGEWREEKIESFPNRQLLIDQYGAYMKGAELLFRKRCQRRRCRRRPAPTGILDGRGEYHERGENLPGLLRGGGMELRAEVDRALDPAAAGQDGGPSPGWLPLRWRREAVVCRKGAAAQPGSAWTGSVRYKQIDEMPHIKALQDLINGNSGRGTGLTTSSL